jgi:hypothetical protein
MDEDVKRILKLLPEKVREDFIKKFRNIIIEANKKGNSACSNKYNIFF